MSKQEKRMELILKLPHTKRNDVTERESLSFSFHPNLQKSSSLCKLYKSINE